MKKKLHSHHQIELYFAKYYLFAHLMIFQSFYITIYIKILCKSFKNTRDPSLNTVNIYP